MEPDLPSGAVDPLTPIRRQPRGPSMFRELGEALLVAILFALFARTFLFQAFRIPSESMETNLLIGDHILVNKFVFGTEASPIERTLLPQRPLRRGDVVVFKFPLDPSRDFIKRCIGLPGDTVELRGKELLVNGRLLREGGYAHYSSDRSRLAPEALAGSLRRFGPYTVPPDHYFFMGDNRDNSNDSRAWGPVPSRLIKGRALMVYWSMSEPGGEDRFFAELEAKDGTWRRLWRHWDGVRRLPGAIRWQRTFRLVR